VVKNEELLKVGFLLDFYFAGEKVMRATILAFDDALDGPVVVVQDGGGDILRPLRSDILEVRLP
jgi:hypothetical protein